MILITLGTQDKQFTRLLNVVQNEIDKGNIKDKVIVQAGHTKFESNDMEIFDLIDREKFSNLISECDVLITHGGVGSIITGLQNNKKVIVAPRLAKYDEHMNDHQLQITENFSKAGYILPLYENDDLGKILKDIKEDFLKTEEVCHEVTLEEVITGKFMGWFEAILRVIAPLL